MTNKILLLYKSKSGFTKRYAETIGKKINITPIDYKEASIRKMAGYDIIIFGTRAHAGTIDGYKKIRRRFLKSGAKHFMLFVTGASPDNSPEIDEFWTRNLSADELQNIPHFYMQSGLCYEKLGLIDKLMMKGLRSMLQKKKDKTERDKAMEQMISHSFDISSDEYMKPLLTYLTKHMLLLS